MFSFKKINRKTTFSKVHHHISRSPVDSASSERSLLQLDHEQEKSDMQEQPPEAPPDWRVKWPSWPHQQMELVWALRKRLYDEGCKVVVSSRKGRQCPPRSENKAEGQSAKGGISWDACTLRRLKTVRNCWLRRWKSSRNWTFLVSNAADNPVLDRLCNAPKTNGQNFWHQCEGRFFVGFQMAAPEMMKNENGGAIVFNSSIAGTTHARCLSVLLRE